jgi:hypothetical protein
LICEQKHDEQHGRDTLFEQCEVIRRARSRVGENRYRLFSNNCEHFCEWRLRGEHRSHQVEALLARPIRMLHMVIRLFTAGGLARGGRRDWHVPILPPPMRQPPYRDPSGPRQIGK